MLLALKRRIYRHLLRDPHYAFLFEPPPPDEAVSVDCETTGLSPRKDDIVTVAAIRISPQTCRRVIRAPRFAFKSNQSSTRSKLEQGACLLLVTTGS